MPRTLSKRLTSSFQSIASRLHPCARRSSCLRRSSIDTLRQRLSRSSRPFSKTCRSWSLSANSHRASCSSKSRARCARDVDYAIETALSPSRTWSATACGRSQCVGERSTPTRQKALYAASNHTVFQSVTQALTWYIDQTPSVEAVLVRGLAPSPDSQAMLASYDTLFTSTCSAQPCRASPADRLGLATWRIHDRGVWRASHRTCTRV